MNPKILLVLALAIISVSMASAEKQDDLIITEEETNSIYFAGNKVVVNESVYADIYAVSGTIDVNRQIQHDLVAIAESINVNAPIGGSVRAITSRTTIDSSVFRDLAIVTSELKLTNNSRIGGNALITANNADLQGEILGDLKIKASTITINNVIHGDARIDANRLELGPDALIRGDVEVIGVTIDEDKVIGEITETERERAPTMLATLLAYLSMGILIIIVGLVLIHTTPRYTKNSIARINVKPIISFLIGILVLIITPLVSFFLFITIIGIPVSVFLLLVYALLFLLAVIYTAIYLGNIVYRLLDGTPNHSISLFIGTILYFLIFSIPLIGKPIIFVLVMISLGAVTASLLTAKPPKKKTRKKRIPGKKSRKRIK